MNPEEMIEDAIAEYYGERPAKPDLDCANGVVWIFWDFIMGWDVPATE